MNNCGNCKWWDILPVNKATLAHKCYRYSSTPDIVTLEDFCCPMFEPRAWELPEALKKWGPDWKDAMMEEPLNRELVLMWYLGEPKQKVGFAIGGVWYKAAGSTTPQPDFWCALPG